MDIITAIRTVTESRDLSESDMGSVMRTIMTGEATPAQIGGFLVGLRMKGETVAEIAAAARVMRELATPVDIQGPHLVDTCGTGGDGAKTFNVSTAAAFVAAGAGARVAKHGNRSVSSSSGSADVLEAAGVRVDLGAKAVSRCIEEVGVGFMFAPMHHGAMRHAIGPRREMGVRTIFNVLGPLTNPAGAPHQVIGVFSRSLVEPLAQVLGQLGSRHVMVVHARDGLDEISVGAPTDVAEWNDGNLSVYTLDPAEFGIAPTPSSALSVDSVQESLALIRKVLAGGGDAAIQGARDIVSLNAGAALYVSGVAPDLAIGLQMARESIQHGEARQRMQDLAALSSRLSEGD